MWIGSVPTDNLRDRQAIFPSEIHAAFKQLRSFRPFGGGVVGVCLGGRERLFEFGNPRLGLLDRVPGGIAVRGPVREALRSLTQFDNARARRRQRGGRVAGGFGQGARSPVEVVSDPAQVGRRQHSPRADANLGDLAAVALDHDG